MRIGLLSQWFSPETGAASVPGVLARSLADRGHEVFVVTGFPNYPTGRLAPGYRIRRCIDEPQQAGVRVRRVALYPSHSAASGKRLLSYSSFAVSASLSGVRALRQVDAVWVYNSPATVGLPSILTSAGSGPPHLMHVMDIWPDSILFSGLATGLSYKVMARTLNAWCSLTYRHAAAIAGISRGIVDLLRERGVHDSKLCYIPVWTDESIFRKLPYDVALAEELQVGGRFTVLYAGNLGGAQRLDLLLDVCERVNDLDDFQVLVVGSGTAEARLKAKAESMQLKNVRFLGQWPANMMGRLLSISDINLISLSDSPLARVTMPSKLPGIMASKRAILAWASGDVARIVTESGGGLVAEPGSTDALEEAIRQAYDAGKDSMERMGVSGGTYYHEHLSLRQGVDAVENRLQAIADSSSRGVRTSKSLKCS